MSLTSNTLKYLPEEEFQMFDQSSEIPLRDLHLSQDLRKLHCEKNQGAEACEEAARLLK